MEEQKKADSTEYSTESKNNSSNSEDVTKVKEQMANDHKEGSIDAKETETKEEKFFDKSTDNVSKSANLKEDTKPETVNDSSDTVLSNQTISTVNLASSLGIVWEGASLFDVTAEDPIVHLQWIEQIALGFTPLQEASYYKMRLNQINKPHAAHVDRVMDRTLLLTYLKKRYGYKSYLEIGCRGDQNFSRVPFADKVGVDPHSGGTVRMTSDAFFASCTRTFDLIFIDGLHESGQVLQDIQNSLHFLKPNGTIVLHDCKPIFEVEGTYPFIPGTCFWNGTVWKAVVVLRTLPGVDICVGDFDWGLGVLRRRNNTNPLVSEVMRRKDQDAICRLETPLEQITWTDYESRIDELLQPKTFLEIHEWLNHG